MFDMREDPIIDPEKQWDESELALLNSRFEAATPQEILAWALEKFGPRLTMATAFGAEGCVLIAMLSEIKERIGISPDIFNLDTGYQFPQTLALKEKLEKTYNLAIRFVRPTETVEEMETRLNGPIYQSNPDLCCNLRKVLPLRSALAGFSAYITAIRRDQTPERSGIPIIGYDPRHGILKLSPLANWTKDDVQSFIKTHDVPMNILYQQGFTSIGCWPCTRPTRDGEDERAGRWAETEKRECGLHLHQYK